MSRQEVLLRHRRGESVASLARHLDVSRARVRQIVERETAREARMIRAEIFAEGSGRLPEIAAQRWMRGLIATLEAIAEAPRGRSAPAAGG